MTVRHRARGHSGAASSRRSATTVLTLSGGLLLTAAVGAGVMEHLLPSGETSVAQVEPLGVADIARGQAPVTAGEAFTESPATPHPVRPTTTPGVRSETPGSTVSQQEPRPVAARIPVISVDAPLVPLGLMAGGQLEAPETGDVAGWFADGPEPGEPGAAVIAGHVDSVVGPAIFWDLGKLTPGDDILIQRVDGSEVGFVVTDIGRWSKNDFPTDAVYQREGPPLLRLVTCGGEWDDERHSYRDNVIVFAEMAEPRPLSGAGHAHAGQRTHKMGSLLARTQKATL